MLNDLAEMDALLSDLSCFSGKRAENAAEKLILRCSHSGEAFEYLQDRMYDVAITERARNHVYLIVAKIRTWMSLNDTHRWQESGYAY